MVEVGGMAEVVGKVGVAVKVEVVEMVHLEVAEKEEVILKVEEVKVVAVGMA